MSLYNTFRSLFVFSIFIVSFLSASLIADTATPNANVPNPIGYAQLFPSVSDIPGGARVTAKFHMKELGSPVSLSILAPVVDPGTGTKTFIELVQIDDKFVHSSTDYHDERSYDLDYAKINAELKQKAPQANLEIGPGTNLYVYGRWMNQPHLDMYTDKPIPGATPPTIPVSSWNHQWGGLSRQGLIVLPGSNTNTAPVLPQSGFTKGGFATALDVTNTMDSKVTSNYPGIYSNATAGSRFENELKLHVDLNDIARIAKYFNDLEQDPNLVEQTFGQGWKLVANRKYVGQPMIDDYMDNDTSQAAEKGMALRYRTGSGITSLNFKPNDGKYADGGVYERIEYDLRNFPDLQSHYMQKFANSTDPVNPLQLIPEQIPGTIPSDFFKKRVRLTDERLKFELTAPSGDQVEISLDHVKAQQLDQYASPIGSTAEFGQLEVEVNHLGAKGSSTNSRILTESGTKHGAELDTFLKGLSPKAQIASDMPPVFHGEEDFKADSPIKTENAKNFQLAFDVFKKLRTGVFGNNWHSSGQKYAVAAAGLGLLPPERYAPSVKRMLEEKTKTTNMTPADMQTCIASLVKVSN